MAIGAVTGMAKKAAKKIAAKRKAKNMGPKEAALAAQRAKNYDRLKAHETSTLAGMKENFKRVKPSRSTRNVDAGPVGVAVGAAAGSAVERRKRKKEEPKGQHKSYKSKIEKKGD